MVIKINYTSSDIYVSTNVSPVYVVVNYSGTGGGGGAAVWGGISGTLSDQLDLQAALDAKVPYTGAIADVDLGEFELKAGQVEFDQTPTGAIGAAVMRWNDSDGTVDLGLKGGNVTLQVGQEQVLRVVNKTGADLLESQYRAVRIRLVSEGGAQGQRLAVVLAQGDNDPDSTTTIGIVTETIANNQEGFITTSGEVRGINTTGILQGETWLDGDIIYLSPTVPGGITKVKPTAPDHMVVLGYVIYAHANNGKIFVKVDNGYELGELHDVYVPTPSNNDGIFWNTANSRYQNNSIAGVLGYTPTRGSGVTGQVAYWNGTSSQTGSNKFLWDNSAEGLTLNAEATGLRGLRVNQFSNDIAASSIVFRKSRGTIASPANVLQYDILSAFEFSARVAGANTFNRSLLGANMATATGIGMYFIAGSTDGNLAPTVYIHPTGNVVINGGGSIATGGILDGGQRLQVYGDAFVRGSGNTSATTALTVQNSSSQNIFRIANNGEFKFGNSGNFVWMWTYSTNYNSPDVNGTNFAIYPIQGNILFGGGTQTQTSGANSGIITKGRYQPTSGNGTFAEIRCEPLINQTGGANGITRGLFVNPDFSVGSGAADWRSIEWSNNSGWGLYGAGTANNYLGGRLGIGNTSPARPIDVLVSNDSPQSIGIKNSSNGLSARAGFIAFSDTNEYGGFSVTSSQFSNSIYRNNANLLASKGIILSSDDSLASSGTSRILFITGGYNNNPTLSITAGNPGRVLIGTTTESTFLLDVNGTARVSGNTTINGYTTINGDIEIDNVFRRIFAGSSRNAVSRTSSGTSTIFYNAIQLASNNSAWSLLSDQTYTLTLGDISGLNVRNTFAPTSGTATFNHLVLDTRINQTGGANGITRGIYIAPSITAAADWRAIEVSSGVSVLAPSSTASATLRIPSGTAPTSPNNGDIWFDGTDLKMRIGGVTKTFTLV